MMTNGLNTDYMENFHFSGPFKQRPHLIPIIACFADSN